MKYALVTGASTGIGQGTAIRLGQLGYQVGLVGRNRIELEKTKSMMQGNAEIFVYDLADLAQVRNLIEQVKRWTGRLDLLANIAGIWHGKNEVYAGIDLENLDQKVVLDTYMVGLVTPTLLVNGLLPIMNDGGCILNLSGTFELGLWGGLPYYVSKRAMEDLTVGLAQELKDKRIKVVGVSPADTATQEYASYFPEDALEANKTEEVVDLILETMEKGENGHCVTIRKGVVGTNGYHK